MYSCGLHGHTVVLFIPLSGVCFFAQKSQCFIIVFNHVISNPCCGIFVNGKLCQLDRYTAPYWMDKAKPNKMVHLPTIRLNESIETKWHFQMRLDQAISSTGVCMQTWRWYPSSQSTLLKEVLFGPHHTALTIEGPACKPKSNMWHLRTKPGNKGKSATPVSSKSHLVATAPQVWNSLLPLAGSTPESTVSSSATTPRSPIVTCCWKH